LQRGGELKKYCEDAHLDPSQKKKEKRKKKKELPLRAAWRWSWDFANRSTESKNPQGQKRPPRSPSTAVHLPPIFPH